MFKLICFFLAAFFTLLSSVFLFLSGNAAAGVSLILMAVVQAVIFYSAFLSHPKSEKIIQEGAEAEASSET